MKTTVYISIGNPDDKLTQAEWSNFYQEVDEVVFQHAPQIFGAWASSPTSRWQNACWAIELDVLGGHVEGKLKHLLAGLAAHYRQDSIAWAVVLETVFIAPFA